MRNILVFFLVVFCISSFADILPWHVQVKNNTDKVILVTAIFGQQSGWKSTQDLGLPECNVNGIHYPNIAGTCIAPGATATINTISKDDTAYQGFSIYQENLILHP